MARRTTEILDDEETVVAPRAGDTAIREAAASMGALVHAERIIDLHARDKAGALQELVQAAAHLLGLDHGQSVDLSAAVQAREAMLNSQLGPGWAAPHATLDVGEDLALFVGRSNRGVDFGRPEFGAVHLVFLFVSPPHGHDRYLKALAQLAGAFKDPAGLGRMRRAAKASSARGMLSALGESLHGRRVTV
ncbi:MAG: PTS sugar transporter subunit IIA, partial [Planctomycetes bacterium]|nr:PTS sugar transporter subunit IIA [Planctomycetota bacterium]